MRVTLRVSAPPGDVFTPEAAASMVGNRPTFTLDHDATRPMGKGEVVAAECVEGGRAVRITLDVPEPVGEVVRQEFTLSGENLAADAGLALHSADHYGESRAYTGLALHTLSRPMPPPFVRRDFAPHPGEDCDWDPERVTLGLSSAPMVVCKRCGDVRWAIQDGTE